MMLFQNISLYKNQKSLFRDSLQGNKTNVTEGQAFLLELPYLSQREFLLKHIHIFPDADIPLKLNCTFILPVHLWKSLLKKLCFEKLDRTISTHSCLSVAGYSVRSKSCVTSDLREYHQTSQFLV